MDSEIVILGGGGFIGRHLADGLAAQGLRVVVATRRPAHFPHPGIRNVVSPFENPDDFMPLLSTSGVVIHAASSSTPGSSDARPQIDGNLRTTLSLIEGLQVHPGCRLLYLSSGGTLYGDSDAMVDEGTAIRPRSYHGAGKAAAEHFIHAWASQYAGTAIVLRPSNVYGPGQHPRHGFGIVPAAFSCVREARALEIWGDGETVRDYLFVQDLVALCLLCLRSDPGVGVHVYNASSGRGVSLNALLEQIELVSGRELRRTHKAERRVDVRRVVPDNQAAGKAFGWAPQVGLIDGLNRFWQWFQTQ